MKTIFKILLVIITFTISFQIAKAGDTLNPCWTMVYPHDPKHGYFNPDSVLYDSCYCKNIYKEGCDSIYAKQWYDITFFNKDPFNFPKYPKDTIIETIWQKLDSSYVELRSIFYTLEIMFGPFILRKEHPEVVDSSSLASRGYIIKFQNYCNIVSVVNYLYSTNYFYFIYYQNRAIYIPDLIVEDDKSDDFNIKIYPIPCYNSITFDIYSDKAFIYDIKIIDNLGNKLLSFENQSNQLGKQSLQIVTDKLAEGIYFCIINIEKNRIAKKFIVFR